MMTAFVAGRRCRDRRRSGPRAAGSASPAGSAGRRCAERPSGPVPGGYSTPFARTPHVRLRPSGSTSLRPTASTPGSAATRAHDAVEVLAAPRRGLSNDAGRIDAPRHRVLRLKAEVDLQQRAEAAEQQARRRPAARRPARPRRRRARCARTPTSGRRCAGAWRSAAPPWPRERCSAGSTPQAMPASAGEPDRHGERDRVDRTHSAAAARRTSGGAASARVAQIAERHADQRAGERRAAGSRRAPAGQVAPARAERHAHRELLPARVDPREQQVREVDAGDRQDARDGAGQHVEGLPEAAAQRVARAALTRAPSVPP